MGGAGYLSSAIAGTLSARDNKSARMDADTNHLIPMRQGGFFDGPTHTLRGEGFDASEDGTGRGTPLVAFNWNAQVDQMNFDEHTTPPLTPPLTRSQEAAVAIPILEAGARTGASTTDVRCGSGIGDNGDPMFTLQRGKQHAVAFQTRIARNGRGQPEEISPTLNGSDSGATSDMRPCVLANMSVRRLTPEECETLQGFPRGFTNIPWRKKPTAPDGPRYKCLGNSMAVPCMAYIGKRIQMVADKYAARADAPLPEIQWPE